MRRIEEPRQAAAREAPHLHRRHPTERIHLRNHRAVLAARKKRRAIAVREIDFSLFSARRKKMQILVPPINKAPEVLQTLGRKLDAGLLAQFAPRRIDRRLPRFALSFWNVPMRRIRRMGKQYISTPVYHIDTARYSSLAHLLVASQPQPTRLTSSQPDRRRPWVHARA